MDILINNFLPFGVYKTRKRKKKKTIYMKALILAAGLGTRLQPLTNNKPKALILYKNKPLLEHAIDKLKKHGFNDIIINIHHFAEQIINFVKKNNNFGINITFSDETEQLLDTGGGLKKAKWFFNDKKSFLVYNVDIFSDINLTEFYNEHNKIEAICTLAVQNRQTSRMLFFDENNYLCKWKNVITGEEKIARKTNTTLLPYAFSGIQMISPKIFPLITEENKFSIIDLYLRLARKHKISYYSHNNSSWLDLGKKENLK